MMNSGVKPSEALAGASLANGWQVVERHVRGPDATGGTFSDSYTVERSENGIVHRAFLKALDLTVASQMPGPLVDSLQILTSAYIFERDLVLRCAGKRMSNVVLAIDAGQYTVNPANIDPAFSFINDVPYIIFERADGDVRGVIAAGTEIVDIAWKLRVLHGAANGLRQLHAEDIAHQDLKASNVMTFGDVGKLGDLGRASSAGIGPANHERIAGDRTYAPPELLYGEIIQDDWSRRRSCDLYHLGSLVVFLISGSGLTPLIEAKLDPAFHWRTWPRDYRNALPYVRDAFDEVVVDLGPMADSRSREDLTRVVRELCDPDPVRRGTPKATAPGLRYALDRYVSLFDRIAMRAELEIKRAGT